LIRSRSLPAAGEVENYLNFIDSGLARKYYKKANEEVNTQISHEGHIIHSQESFHSRTPSEYAIETIEPTELTSITYDCLEKMYSSSEKYNGWGDLLLLRLWFLKINGKASLLSFHQEKGL
jgi:CRP-like cAMP-binding protein